MAGKSSATQVEAQSTSEQMNAPSIQPVLAVDDVAKAVQVYRALGFRVLQEMPAPTGKGLSHAVLSYGSSFFHVAPAGGPHAPHYEKRGRAIEKGPRGLGPIFYTFVPDLDATYKLVRKAKLNVLYEPREEFWGDRLFGCLDPFGYEWGFAQHLRDPTPEEMMKAAAAQRA